MVEDLPIDGFLRLCPLCGAKTRLERSKMAEESHVSFGYEVGMGADLKILENPLFSLIKRRITLQRKITKNWARVAL